MPKIDISFNIRAYNEEKFLPSLFTDLIPKLKAAKANSEINVGIQGTDRSYAIAKSFQKQFRNFRIFRVKKKGPIANANFLIDKARSDVIVADDADFIFDGNIDNIVNYFKDPKVGAIVQLDARNVENLSKGMAIFERTYEEVKLKKYLDGNVMTDPIIGTHIYRKSAISEQGKEYTRTFVDDNEIVKRLMDRKYKVIYDKDLAYHLLDNPLQAKLTITGVFKRRVRSAQFRRQAKEMLNTNKFSIWHRLGDWLEAFLITCTKVNAIEFLEVCEWLIIVGLATIYGEIILRLGKDNKTYASLRNEQKG